MGAFQGGYKRPGAVSDLHTLVQKQDETLWKYTQCFCQVLHTIPDVSPHAIIAAFHANVRNPKMREKLSTRTVQTGAELFSLANKGSPAEEGRMTPEEVVGGADDPGKPKAWKSQPAK